METKECKRKRSTNFTSIEENVLHYLVTKYRDTIENKKYDAHSKTTKREAWINITKEYNNICTEVCRDENSLRNKYDNMKRPKSKNLNDISSKEISGDCVETNCVKLEHDGNNDIVESEIIIEDNHVESTNIELEHSYLLPLDNNDDEDDNDGNLVASTNREIDLQKSFLLERHQLKLSLLKKEFEEKRKILILEHTKKMEILDLKKQMLLRKIELYSK